ncbi:protein-glutamate methylesterase/protein-glutamine glutaminase [Chitinimonas lacunae]|uniref:Protein-glutamate methylesterase/protein-glutamine glutaminase n=1 Tax=Chitinimonas lacunae TaxID=1963018 RepID=A0ABV8MWQ8_9NEIS
MKRLIRVIVIDDSALMRKCLVNLINAEPDMEVIATAPEPLTARELIRTLNPDVVTLDIEMPKMNGLDFLEKLMRLKPMPVLMVSSLTEEGSQAALRALELGAFDCVGKPRMDSLGQVGSELIAKLRAAAAAPVSALLRPASQAPKPSGPVNGHGRLIAIGASTGGTQAIQHILADLPANMPPIMVVQHMPATFTGPFARRLDTLCALTVREASHGEPVESGTVYIAPGGKHMTVIGHIGQLRISLNDHPPVNGHRPAVDVLFGSVAKLIGRRALGLLLTGMGSDGARGLLEMKQAGAYTAAQDKDSSVVFGMPQEAIKLGAADEVLALEAFADALVRQLRGAAG